MDKNFLIGLTNNLYRLTLLFPKKEPLRYKMRELADEILALVTQHPELNNSIIVDLEVLDGFFEVAKNQNWVKISDILEIQKEYSKIREESNQFEAVSLPEVPIEIGSRLIQNNGLQPTLHPPKLRLGPSPTSINQRQEKILEILKEKGRAQVWEIKQIFPDVSKRTLRRDFEFLLKHGKIERIGERNETFYVPRQQAGQLLS